MNKIYKVVWSKVKNCYIVVSELAKNVISGSVKSAKVGATPVVKGMALGAMMAFVITGNVWAGSSVAIEAKNGTEVVVNDNTVNVGKVYAGNDQSYTGDNNAVVDMTAVNNITISGTGNVIQADKDGVVLIGSAGSETNITGDIYTDNGGSTRVVLGTEDSVFTGSTKVGSNDGAIVLGLYDGATWEVTKDSNVSKVTGNRFNIVAADGIQNAKVIIDGDNSSREDIYEDAYNGEDLPDSGDYVIGLKNVDFAIIDPEGGGLEAGGEHGNISITSNRNVEGVFGKEAFEIEGSGEGYITAANVTFNTGRDTVLVYDAEDLVNDGKGIATINATGNVELSSTNGNAIDNASTNGSEIKVTGEDIVLSSSYGAAIAVGHDIRNSSYNGVVTVGDENTKTVTITGATQDLGEVYDEYGTLINFNEDNRAIVFAQGDVNITATEKVEINDTTVNKKAIAAYGGANVIIDGGKKTVINGEINADGHEYSVQSDGNIHHQDNNKPDDINILIKGEEIIVDADVEASESVFARGDSSGIDNAVIVIGDENTEKVYIGHADTGLVASDGGSKVEVNSNTLIINADGSFDDDPKGIHAESSDNIYDKIAVIDVNVNKTEITVEDGQMAIGVCAYGKANVNVAGDLDIIATTDEMSYGIFAGNDGIVNAIGNVDITATGYSAYGLEVLDQSTVQLGTTSKNVSVSAIGSGENGEAIAVYADDNSEIDIIADKLSVSAKNLYEQEPGSSLQAKDGSEIAVNANDAIVHGVVYAGGEGAIVNLGNAKNLKLTSDSMEDYGITPVVEVERGGKVILGNRIGKTEIEGDIFAHDGGQVDVTLNSSSSVFEGSAHVMLPDSIPGTDESTEGTVNLSLLNGAVWEVTEDSTVTSLSGTGGNVINTTGEVITLNVVNYGDNDQHDGEGRFSGATLTNENLIINGVNLVVDTWETVIYNNNVKVDSDSDITIKSAHDDGICAFGEVEIEGKNVTIEAYDNGIKTSGYYDSGEDATNGQNRLDYSNVTINADNNVTIKSTEYGEGYALTNNGGNINIVAGNNVELVSHDRPAVRAAYGITESNINVTGKNITVAGKAREHEDSEFKPSVIYAQGIGVLNFSATDNISISDTAKIGGNAVGAYDGGVVNIKNATNVVLDGKVYANGEDAIVNFDNVENITIASSQGSAVNNASTSSVINIGDEKTKNITITGKTEGSREVYDIYGNFVNYNEDNRAVIYSKGTVDITATEKVVINDTGVKTKALSAYGDANVTIDGGKQTIINGEITADGLGPVLQSDGNVEHQDNGIADNINVLIKGKEIIVDASLEAEEGIFARGDSTGIDNAVITVGDANTEKVTVRDVDTGLFAWNGGSKVEVNSDSLVISADGNFNDSAMGICAYNENADGNKLAVIDVNANKTEITVEDGAFAYGVLAEGKSSVNVSGDVDIIANGTSAFGVNAKDNAVVELGNANSDVTFNVNADELDYSGESRAEAIAARENNVVKVLGNMIASVNGRDWVSGVESEDNSVVELGNVALDVSTNGNEFSEASGINAARKGTVKVNGDLDAAVTGGEWATGVEAGNGSSIYVGNGSSEVNLSASAKGNMSKDEDWAVSAIGILSVGRTNPIVGENGEVEKEAYGGSTVNFNAAKLTVSATADNGLAYGVYAEDDGAVNANGNVDITATGYSAHGIEVRENSTVQLGAIGKDVSITATSTGEAGEAIAVYAGEYSNVNIVADTLDVNIQSIYDGGSLQAKRGSTIYVNANDASVHGIVAADYEGSVVNLTDAKNLTLTADYMEDYGITPVVEAELGGRVIVGNTTGKTEIVGDIFAHDGGQVDVTLNSTSSVFEGSASTRLPDSVPGADESTEGTVNLSLLNGAAWNSYDDSYITTLTMANGVINMFGSGQTISVDSLKGTDESGAIGTILVTDLSNRLDVTEAEKGTELQVAYDGTYGTIVDKKGLILESNKKLDDIVTGDGASNIKVNKNFEIQNTAVLGNYNLDANGDLVVKIDADNLNVDGNVQATTFNGINLTEALDSKANKATTLAGYGITDAYTKAEVNAKIEDATGGLTSNANVSEIKNKTQNISSETTSGKTVITGNVEVSGNVKAATFNGIDLSTLAKKTEVDKAISGKADVSYVDSKIENVTKAYKDADSALETKVTNAYKDADSALETKVTNAYKAADTALETKVTKAYKAADVALETKVTKAYKAADVALESKVTKAYKDADAALETKVTKAYKAADKVLETNITNAYKAEDIALEAKLTEEYKLADSVLETKVISAYEAADVTLEVKLTNAYQATDNKLSGRITATEDSISLLSANIAGMEDGYKSLDVALESKVTDAYEAADVALESKITKAYEAADVALESKVTKAYQAADKALESKVTKAYKAADAALESKVTKAYKAADAALESKVTKAYKAADTALEAKVTKAYKAADAALETQIKSMQSEDKALESRVTKAYQTADAALQSEVTKAYQAADKALDVELTGLISGKADKATTLKGYGITDAYTKSEIEKMLKYTGDNADVEELKNKIQNISEHTTEGITIVNGSIQVFGDVTAQYGNFFTGATFADDAVRIASDGIVRFGESGNDANVTIYSKGSTSIDAKGAVVAGSIVSGGQVEASGNIMTTTGDVMAGNVSLKETAQALEGKADKADTLSGYGITDAYTKAEVDSKLDGKVDAKDVYSKTEVDNQIANVGSEVAGKADKSYVDSNFAKTSDVYTKEEADATFVKRTELATIDENGNIVAIASKTELGENFVVEDTTGNGSKMTINEGSDNEVAIASDGITIGQHSVRMDSTGFYAGGDKPHTYDSSNSAIHEDGRIKGAGGRFEVAADGSMKVGYFKEENSEKKFHQTFGVDAKSGNVTAVTYNGVDINQVSTQVDNNTEAITGLNQRLGKLSGKVNKVGAGAAALAALHPLEYDPDDKLTFSAGIGNYAGENAAAIGAFYRPDEKLMFSLGGTMGNGENMANLGVSIGFASAKGYPNISKKELVQAVGDMLNKNKAMKLENQAIKAENEAIKAENEAIKAEVAELKALVVELMAKK